MKRPSYRAAINWLAYNDDNSWLDSGIAWIDGQPRLSPAAWLVAELFDVERERLVADLRRARARLKLA